MEEGEGWVKLSDKIYVCNRQPLATEGRVYKGKQQVGSEWRVVAVKLIPSDEKSKEVKLILKTEEHPNVIRIFETGVTKDTIPQMYIVMEHCFQSLRSYIDGIKNNPVEFKTGFTFTKQIFEAISFIHQQKILHRDLKLDNILLLTPQGPVKVADFGLSKELTKSRSETTCSVRGLGSDGYIAPELYGIDAKSSVYSDVFALGVITYEIFTSGKHPFGPDPLRWRTNIVDNKSPDYLSIPQFKEPFTRKRAQLIELLHVCLQHEPSRRLNVEDLLKQPFFTDLSKAENTIIIGTLVANKVAMGNATMKSSDQNCCNSLLVNPSKDRKINVAIDSESSEIQIRSETVTWSKFINVVKDVKPNGSITVSYAGNPITCSVSSHIRFRGLKTQVKFRGKCRDQNSGEMEEIGHFENPKTAARKALTLLVKKMISKNLYPPPCDPENLDVLF